MNFRVLVVILCWLLGVTTVPPGAKAQTEPNTLSTEELAEGWVLLFDGQTTFGWKAANKANWSVQDGAIRVNQGEKGLLYTTTTFADYELKLEFQAASGTNSGVFLRTLPKIDDATTQCYELNIAPPENPFPTGSLVGRIKYAKAGERDRWRRFHVSARGGNITVKLDGKQIVDYTDAQALSSGHIGLQLNSGAVAFRNIKLKPLGLRPVFNGRDLTGWKTDQAQKSVFSVTKEGYLNVKNGRGQLESQGQYADFVLQLEIFSNGKHLNSGIFFRNIPGSFTQGYESQIHNGYQEGDRTKPMDFGTGGIYRRQPARRVVADDFTWFTKTLMVHGNHVAVWVDGYQVTDWFDRRPPNENPRRGLRTQPGTLAIQGHDPTTDLSFRKLNIAKIPPRTTKDPK